MISQKLYRILLVIAAACSPMLLLSRMASETRAMTPGISVSSAVRTRSRGRRSLKRTAQRIEAPARPLMVDSSRTVIAMKPVKR